MRLLIQTQVRENYGAHAWDGTGECPQYWKNKGGDEIVVPLTVEQASKGYSFLSKLVSKASEKLTRADNYFEIYVFDWQLLDNGELTPDEKLMEGERPAYSPKCLEISDLE